MSKRKAYNHRLEELFANTEPVAPEPTGAALPSRESQGWAYSYLDTASAMDRDLSHVLEIGRLLSRERNLEALLSQATQLIGERFGLYAVLVYLADRQGESLNLAAAWGPADADLTHHNRQLPVDAHSIIGIALTTEQPVVVPDVHQHELFIPHPALPETCAELALPLITGQQAFGVMELHLSKPDDLTPPRQTIFEILAGRLAAAIENLQIARGGEAVPPGERPQTYLGWEDFLDAIHRKEHIGYRYDVAQADEVIQLSAPLPSKPASSPETTLTVPLTLSGQSIGVIQLEKDQNAEIAPWSPEEGTLVQAVADRVTQHLENLRLLAQAERYRFEAEEAARRLTRQGWENYASSASLSVGGYVYDLEEVRPIPEAEALRTELLTDVAEPARREIKVRDEPIGELALADVGADDEIASSILSAVADRLSTHIENLRLLEETERSRQQLDKRAAELETVARVSTAAATILSPQELLQSVVDLTKYSFNLYHVHVFLLSANREMLVLKAGAGKIGYRMVEEGLAFPMAEGNALAVRVARSRQGAIVNDVRLDPDFFSYPLLPDTLSALSIPMVVGDQLLGVFEVLASVTNRFTEEDMRTFVTLAAQVSVALRNAELYAEQMAAVLRLRELDHLKNSFLANMSHELRTPLNSILGFTQVIMEGLDGPLTDDMTNDLALIEKNGRHLLNLINEILDMAKIEAGRMSLSPEPVNLRDLLSDVVESSAGLVHEKNLYLWMENEDQADITLMLDYTRMRQVFLNLIGNAAKFTEKGGITVQVERQSSKVLVNIRDTGIGIPPDKLEMIFEAFSQVDTSTTRKAGGTGLGLPISRRLVEMHGGRLWAESTGNAGEGSNFVVELPIAPVAKV